MENHHSSPTNNANIPEEDLISANHINELPVNAVLSNYDSNGNQIKSAEEIESYISSFPPGFRFFPTDDELVTHYLKRKLDNLPLQPNKIHEIKIYKYNPETIAAHVKPTTEEKVWYILTPRDRKYRHGNRPSRSAGDGYWKATGADKQIKDHKNTLIGLKKALVFYIGRSPNGEKTDWIMHEYRVPEVPDISERDANDWTLDDWVLCKIYKRSDTDNTMFTQRMRSRGRQEYIDEKIDTNDGKVHESSNENFRHGLHDTLSGAACQDSTRNGLTNCIDMLYNPNNHATIFHPQVPTRLPTFPQSSYMPTFCNMSWPTTSVYDYPVCVPQFNSGAAPLPVMIEPISSTSATNTSFGDDHTKKPEGFGIPCFSSCFGGDCTGQECFDWVDQYLVNNYEMNDYTMYVPEYNTMDFVNGESSKSKGDC